MDFEDEEIKNLAFELTSETLSKLIVSKLCGVDYELKLHTEDQALLSSLFENAKTNGLTYNQFNELLYLLNQDKAGKDFFRFFFGNDSISLKDIVSGIMKFRGYAMLCFGNFEIAYHRLAQLNSEEIERELSPYHKESSAIVNEFGLRPKRMLEIGKIQRDQTWFLGEITGTRVNVEAQELEKEIAKAKKQKSSFKKDELMQFMNELIAMGKLVKAAQRASFVEYRYLPNMGLHGHLCSNFNEKQMGI